MLTAITGHYGCGKTEFAINYALSKRAEGLPVTIADLDIVNPYFCTRERKQTLEELGLRVIVSLGGMQIDIPALPAEILTMFEDNVCGIMDVGGDSVGARVLARYEKDFARTPHELLCVLNFNRPEVGTVERAIDYIGAIEQSSHLIVTGLVNTTHLLGDTSIEDIMRGADLSKKVASITGIPLRYNTAPRRLLKQAQNIGDLFLMDIFMNKPWEEEFNGSKSDI